MPRIVVCIEVILVYGVQLHIINYRRILLYIEVNRVMIIKVTVMYNAPV